MLGPMLFTILAVLISAQSTIHLPEQKPFDDLSFMVGRWTGEGTGAPGNGVGEFSFEWDLGRNVLIRRSFAEYPATPERPASRHDDLMVVFVEAGKLKAEYFDSEGHVIHYRVMPAADSKSVEFLSEPPAGAPRYRLTYTKAGDPNSMKLKFEIANPDKNNKADVFTPYIDATLRRIR